MGSSDERIVALLKEARHQLELERSRRTEPIAIVGIGCRLPAAGAGAEGFWRLLCDGVDATREVPAERWDAEQHYDPDPETVGKAYTRRGAFLDQVDTFDADFFGISPREALGMDPQQRLLLEVTWEALEDAGILPERLRGSATGVWVGLCVDDYARRSVLSSDSARIDAYNTLGNTRSVAAGRISYVLDLHGPAVQLDTACSSSLVAVHQACHSLRSRESDLALVGGVNLMLAPESTIALCKLRALAPDGRCKTFDASADGYGRGEGCAMVVLRRLADARAAGDRIYAVVRGTAINHDGHSNGLTAPSGIAQEAVIRSALDNAGVEARSVGYVEAHGTGTLLGDPIEVLALQRVYGQARSAADPLLLGALKTNVGHLEGAAGIAGLIKSALCLSHGQIPASLHFNTPNPKIPWADLAVRVADQQRAWPRGATPRLAAVSSFGISGTNAHIVLEEAPAATSQPSASGRSAELFVLSAKTPDSLAAAARNLAEHLQVREQGVPDQVPLGNVAFSLATTRSTLEHRLAVVARSRVDLLAALTAAGAGQTPLGVQQGKALVVRGKLAWLFTGQGAQRLGMGGELYAEWSVFREALDRVCAAFDTQLSVALREVMWAAPDSRLAASLDQTGFTQPALFALEYALACLWRSWGVEPDVLLGHSVGQLAAAAFAEVFSLEDAVRLVSARARAMQALPAGGAMLALPITEARALEALQPFAQTVSLAAVNGPSSVVLSGVAADVEALARRFEARGVQGRRLVVSHAFHSPLMEPMLAAFREVAESIQYRPPRIPLVADSTGALAGAEIATAEYWVQHVRGTVHFARGVQALAAAGARTFLELGPRPTLLGLVSAGLPDAEPVLLAALRPGRSEPEAILDALGGWHVRGGSVDWSGVFPDGGARVPLPRYAWQARRFWMEPLPSGQRAEGEATEHPLLGVRIAAAGADAVYESQLAAKEPAWLQDHQVGGQIVLPAAAIAELVRAAVEDFAGGSRALDTLELHSPLVLAATGARRVQIVLSEQGSVVAVHSRPVPGDAHSEWTLHASARAGAAPSSAPPVVDLATLRQRCADAVPIEGLYAAFASVGLGYGPAFRGLRQLWRGQGEVLAEVAADEAASGYGLSPTLLDAAFQSLAALLEVQAGAAFVPFELRELVVHQLGVSVALAHVQLLEPATADAAQARVTLLDAAGGVVAELGRLSVRRIEGSLAKPQARTPLDDFFHQLTWQGAAAPAAAGALSGRWRVVAWQDAPATAQLASELRALGASVEVATSDELKTLPPAEHVLCVFTGAEGDTGALGHALRAQTIAQATLQHAPSSQLWWVTCRAVAVTLGDEVEAAASSVWGFGRSLRREHPELRCTLLDVEQLSLLPQLLARELSAADDEDQVAWRAGQRRVARLLRAPAPTQFPSAPNYQLEIEKKGTLDALRLQPCERRLPAATEVEIQVVASGLNFRDVLNALGMYPGEAGPLGGECSGIVTAVGSAVSGLRPGAAVMALAPGAFRRFVTLDARLVAAVPRGLSLEQAATIPAVFLTAWHALHDLAQLQPGERILVHAAAGGVGMAAVQLARWIGAEVFATASESKWDAVRALGVKHIASSRDVGFAQAFRSAGGIDVVLNSLAGELIDASVSLLAAGGRFIEMGKTDLRDAAQIESARPGVSYRAFDLAQLEPERIATLLAAITQGFDSGRLQPLPVRSFPLTQAELAFRFMAQARHIGKIALLAEREELRTAGTALITGGLGALGLEVARGLARRGVQHLLLTGRRGLETPGAAQAVTELEGLGAKVTVAALDVADRAALEQALRAVPAQYPLRAVVHAAGVLDDGVIPEQTAERLTRVMTPKVSGAWHLHELTESADLDLFVLFSSLAGTVGSPGQSGYAAANAFLDGLAALRRARGLPAISLAWGPWAESGFAARLNAAQQARFSRQGIALITPDQGRALFARALTQNEAQLMVVRLDLRTLARALGEPVPPLWRALLRVAPARGSAAQSDWRRELAALGGEERLDAIRHAVRSEIARVLSASSANAVPLESPLKDLGLDSLMAVELRNALGRRVGVSLPATLAFDYPTPEAIARHLLEDVLRLDEPVRLARVAAAPSPRAADEPIAIVGIGCRFPGGASDPAAFWQLLDEGVDAITEVPSERWDVEQWYDPDPRAVGKMTTRWGGFLRDLDRFDPGFFGISPREAVSIDPQERLLLETTWEALEHAGLKAESLMGSASGVYMGLCGTEYQNRMMANASTIDPYALLGTMHSTIVGRLSYWLGLKGPSVPIDTACSSSLVAVHLACQALRDGECDLALAGGANVMLAPEGTVYFSRLGTLSPTGRCRSFSADADGYVRAEGAGVVVLERLSVAQQKGRRILAIIRGSAVNQSGRSNGLAAPNGLAQQEVIRKALTRADVAPAEIGFVECFGTATALGDPIEVQALGAVLAEGRSPESPVVLGTLKTNLGHMEGAAGVGGLIKAVLALQHERIPRNLHFTSPNPHIPWAELPVTVATETVSWPRHAKPRFAGVSSFGIAGTNAHVVLQEGPLVAAPPPAAARAAELVVLSAKTPAALRAAAARLSAHLEQQPALELGALAQALSTQRSLLDCRLALSVTSRSSLLADLARVAQGQAPLSGVLANVEDPRPTLAWSFAGAGTTRLGMGRELAAQWPAFREAFESVCRLLAPALEQPLREVMWAAPGSSAAKLLERADYAALARFAFEWAHARAWQSWGIEPALVFGQGSGELLAACCAGVFSIEDASRLLVAQLKQPTELLSVARSIAYQAPRVRLQLAGARGELVGDAAKSPDYWARDRREQPPPFEPGTVLPESGAQLVLELGPAPAPVLHGEAQAVLAELAGWVARGGELDWAALFPGPGAHVELPGYAWQRERYWVEAAVPALPVRDGVLLKLREWLGASQLSPAAAAALPEILAALADTPGHSSTPTARGAESLRDVAVEQLEGLGAEERRHRLLALVQGEAARTLSIADSASLPWQTPLLQLGMDSFMAVELRARLERRVGLPPTSGLALDPALTTVMTLARDLELLLQAYREQHLQQLDLASRMTLDDDIRGLAAPLVSLEPTSVLLTGATGFLGAFLLSELLLQTKAHVTCLVRAESPRQGLERLEKNLRAYGLAPPEWRSRVSTLVGDLAQPRLGLSEAAFRSLAREVDAIVNNGSHVSYVAGYTELEPAHVFATREVLRLASEGRPKAVHHVSSTAVFDSLAYRGQTLDERSVPTVSDGIELPYSQCKWVSEGLVREAIHRGIPATIHRPSFIGGATNGAWNTTDFLCRIFKGGLIGLGYYPEDLELVFDFTPVDTVARSIVHLSRQTAARGRTFHLQHPTGVRLSELVSILRSLGYSLEPLPYVQWLARIAKDKASPLYPLTGFLAYRSPADGLTALERSQLGYRPVFDGEATARELARAGIQFPALDRALFYRYFAGLASVGFLSEPTATVDGEARRGR